MVMKEFGELLSQHFIAFATVTEHDGALEQCLLNLLRQLAPKSDDGSAHDVREAV